jgi:regulatory protein PHO2
MEVPFEIITNADTHNISSAQARAIFSLTRPPDFYMEETIRAQGIKHWKKCDDWTQGMQATKVLQHEIIGSAVQLVNALNIFRDVSGVGSSASTSGGSSAQRSPTFVGSPSSQTGAESSSNAALQPVRLQPPPLMGLTPSPTFSYPNPAVQQLRPSHPSQGRRRSFTGPPSYTDASNNLLGPLAPLARDTMPGSMGIPTSSTYLAQTGTASSMQQYFSNYMQSSYSSYPLHGSSSSSPTQPVFPNQIPQPTSLSDYSSVPISHSVASRPSNPSQQFAPPFPSTRRFSEISASTSSSSGFVTLNSPLSTSTFISSNSGPHVRESNSSDSRIGVDMHSPTLHHSDMALSYSSYLTPQDTSNRPTTSEPTDVAALQTPALADGSRSNAESTYDDPTQSTRS